MSFLGGYGQISNDYNSGMFSGFGYSQPGFGWDFTGGEYSSWGTSPPAQQGKRTDARGYGEEYYHPESLQPMDSYAAAPMNGELERGDGIRTIDQGLKGVSISDARDTEQVAVKENLKPIPSDQVAQNSNSPAVPPKKITWASVASQPAKPQPQVKPKSIPRAPVLPSKHNMDIGTWDMKNNVSNKQGMGQPRQAWSGGGGTRRGNPGPYASGPNMNRSNDSSGSSSGNATARNSERSSSPPVSAAAQAVLDKLKSANHYNPKEFNVNLKNARFFIIKSYSEDDIHRSIKYSIWCSTEHGNKRLEEAYRERDSKGPIYLLYSVNGSGHFCGMAQMMTNLDPNKDSNVWAQSKWKGQFEVKWIYVKDVPNSQLRHIRLENNENKPVTNSRDTQEVPFEKGKQVLKIMHNYRHTTSIFDDFVHYEKRQEEDTREMSSDRRDNRDGRDSRKVGIS
jgi:hypothetical protein